MLWRREKRIYPSLVRCATTLNPMRQSLKQVTKKQLALSGTVLLTGLVFMEASLMWGGWPAAVKLATETLVITVMLLVLCVFLMVSQIRNLRLAVIKLNSQLNKEAEVQAHNLSNMSDLQSYTRSLIESNIDAMVVLDLHGVIIDLNKQAELSLGYAREELIGSQLKKYGVDADNTLLIIARILDEGKVNNVEMDIYARNGSQIPFSCNAAILYANPEKATGVIISMRDITNHKKIEQLLEENNLELQNAMAIAERANLAKSTFLSNMSHELRTPLNAILGFAQLMDTDEALPKATVKLSIEQILHGGWYLLDLINEILDLASIESGKVHLLSEKVSVAEVMSDCHNLIAQQAEKKFVQLVFPPAESANVFVRADQTRLKQVLINLLSNAIKYNRVGGEVRILCQQKAHGVLRISVQDNGVGMTPLQLTHMFEPFNRLGREGSAEDGTGIGLVVTRQLIQIMNGTMGVESAVGVGSTFWIELPGSDSVIPAAQSVAEPDRQEQPLMFKKTVEKKMLYIEDNVVNQTLIEQLMFMRSDIKLLVAGTGQLGLELARSAVPDLILLDINLPDIHGFELMKILKIDPLTRNIPVIALSANAMQIDIDKGLSAGCLYYLTKPINVKELMDKLDETLFSTDPAKQAPKGQNYQAI